MLPSRIDLPPTTRLGRAKVWWKQYVRPHLEYWGPFGVGGAVFLGVSCCSTITPARYETLLRDVVPVAVSVAAIFAGFQGTIHTILLSMKKSKAVARLRDLGLFDQLLSYIHWGVFTLILFVAAAMIALTWRGLAFQPAGAATQPTQEWSVASQVLIGGLAGLFSFSLAASARIAKLTIKMLGLD